MNSSWIDVTAADGGTFKSYLSLPPTGRGPGILLIQEIFGINDHIRGVADQYAMDGYVVLAPDLFWRLEQRAELGYGEADFKKGLDFMTRLDFAKAVQDLASASQVLRGLPTCSGKVASLGYCMGGLLSYLCAANIGVDAALCYYGGGIDGQLGQAAAVKCPILFHFADKDGFIPASAVDAVKKAFAGRSNATIHTYPEVDHGFNCWARGSYNQPAAALAHGRSLEFLSVVL